MLPSHSSGRVLPEGVTIKPHDALFKAAFERPQHAAGLFRDLLPAPLVNSIDWSTLALEPGSYVDPTLGTSHSDLLFSVRLHSQGRGDERGEELLLYVLLEHQSINDRAMPLRSLGYIVRIWERRHRQRGGPLPLIIALVVSHAPDGWTAPVHLHEMITPSPALAGVTELVPGFKLLVEDLAHLTNEQLKARALEAFPKLVLWALRDARNADRLLDNLEHWADEFDEVLRTGSGIAAVSLILRYVAQVCEHLHYQQFREKIREQLPEAERSAMTMAEELMEMGRAEVRAEADAALRHLLLKQLARKFGEVPPQYSAAIETGTAAQLERYAERIVVVDTLAAVFADDD
jgi:predicted transposase/invertase (TIGR01784 family)